MGLIMAGLASSILHTPLRPLYLHHRRSRANGGTYARLAVLSRGIAVGSHGGVQECAVVTERAGVSRGGVRG